MPRTQGLPTNMAAFLDLLAWSELGQALIDLSDDGYNVLVGATPKHLTLFDSYHDHPRVKVDLPNLHIYSTAAGRYQFIWRTWAGVKEALDLPDFSPESQDRAAIKLIKQRGAYADVLEGKIAGSIAKCAREWASFPVESRDKGYYGQQHSHKLAVLLDRFKELSESRDSGN